MSTTNPYPSPPGLDASPVVAVILPETPAAIVGADGQAAPVRLTPSLEAALWREFNHGHKRLMAWRSANHGRPCCPSRYESWSVYIQAALSDWLYGPVPAWDGEARR